LVQPGDQYAITGADGHYRYLLGNGSYTLEQTDATLVPICPPVQPVPFTVATDAHVIDLANGSTAPLDLALYASNSAARPGMTHTQAATVRNLTPQASGPVTVTCTFDAQLVYQSAVPTPDDITGNTITWQFPAFGSFASQHISMALDVPAATPLGTPLTSTWAVSNTLPDANAANDVQALNVIVTGSFDPNDKQVRTSTGQLDDVYLIDEDHWLDYTIRFQNTGTDTAFTVVVSDVLAPELDMASFEQGTASHAFDVAFKPGRMVEWRFANILLPDSGTNEAASHGLVHFRIRPKAPLVAGTVITNHADIFFDANAPVRTNDAVITLETSTGLAEMPVVGMGLYPSPTEGPLTLTVPDAPNGTYLARVFGADGRQVRSESVAVHSGKAALDLGGMASGLYLVRLEGQGGLTWMARSLMR
jgi:hypothetical protein